MIDIPPNTRQIIVVTTPSWESYQGRLYQFEQEVDRWILQKSSIPVVVGKKGMGWGLGLSVPLSSSFPGSSPLKCEGDNKAPAGIFTLGPAFGHQVFKTPMDFLPLHPEIEAVNDPLSCHYNRIVNRKKVAKIDWTSSEKMGEIGLYALGLVIHHNWDIPLPGAGSAIFMHLWRDEKIGTAGCTAMSYQDLASLLTWLNPQTHPLLIQMPFEFLDNFWQKCLENSK